MAFVDHQGFIDPGVKAASTVNPYQPVKLDTVADQVVPIATVNDALYGFNGDATVLQGEAITIYGRSNIVKAVAGASLGHGAVVGLASTNGALGPISGASGSVKYGYGESRSAAAAGEIFSLHVSARQLSGLA